MTDKYLAAEEYLQRYVRDHPNDPADAAVNWAALQRSSITIPVARAAMWRLVATGKLEYSWDGLLSFPTGRHQVHSTATERERAREQP